jgi:hypothetical protein
MSSVPATQDWEQLSTSPTPIPSTLFGFQSIAQAKPERQHHELAKSAMGAMTTHLSTFAF